MRIILLLSILGILGSCKSTEKTIAHLQKEIPVKALKKDIQHAKKKLFLMHPDLDWYIDKNQLANAFDSLERATNKPATPKEFYHQLAPIISQVRQGHTKLVYPTTPVSDSINIKLKGSVGPLSQLKLDYKDDQFVILKDSSINASIPSGSILHSINDIQLSQWADSLKQSITPDGYDRPFSDYFIANNLNSFFTSYYGVHDSLRINYEHNSQRNNVWIHRISKSVIDSLKHADSVAKADTTQKDSMALKNKYTWGYDSKTNIWAKDLQFIDTHTALLTIRNFGSGNTKKLYSLIFDSLAKQQTKRLIIDLRGNPGGRISEIHHLLGYLTSHDSFRTILPNTVISKKRALNFWTFYNLPKWTYPIAAPFFSYNAIQSIFTIKKNAEGKLIYQMKESRMTKRQEKAFDGDIIVWIDEGTFSAATILSANLKGQENVKLIGRETGGAQNGTVAGRLPMVKLKYSKLRIRIGTMNIIPTNNYGTHGRGVMPDVEYNAPSNIIRPDNNLEKLSL